MALSVSEQKQKLLKIDRLGRIVIPHDLREHLNLQPGSKLELFLEQDDRIVLKVVAERPETTRQNGVLVIQGELSQEAVKETTERVREERIKDLSGL
ncbi:MAG: AbrB/MazE/SpoVT family DNA-binding domain-containing protein [Deltaproteobacteria bacterium]|nr:AbrB/MazE/SpoVT family DNA-binding domain-containing protein [Deltaproteobacteria bacterium]